MKRDEFDSSAPSGAERLCEHTSTTIEILTCCQLVVDELWGLVHSAMDDKTECIALQQQEREFLMDTLALSGTNEVLRGVDAQLGRKNKMWEDALIKMRMRIIGLMSVMPELENSIQGLSALCSRAIAAEEQASKAAQLTCESCVSQGDVSTKAVENEFEERLVERAKVAKTFKEKQSTRPQQITFSNEPLVEIGVDANSTTGKSNVVCAPRNDDPTALVTSPLPTAVTAVEQTQRKNTADSSTQTPPVAAPEPPRNQRDASLMTESNSSASVDDTGEITVGPTDVAQLISLIEKHEALRELLATKCQAITDLQNELNAVHEALRRRDILLEQQRTLLVNYRAESSQISQRRIGTGGNEWTSLHDFAGHEMNSPSPQLNTSTRFVHSTRSSPQLHTSTRASTGRNQFAPRAPNYLAL